MEFARHVHGYLNSYIHLADAKAAAVFVVVSGMMGFLVDSAGTFSRHDLDVPKAAWFSAAMLVNVLALLLALLVVRPRLSKGTPGRFIYWGDILEFKKPDAYARELAGLNDGKAVEHVAVHNWHLAKVANAKYRLLLASFVLAGLGLLASIPFAVVY